MSSLSTRRQSRFYYERCRLLMSSELFQTLFQDSFLLALSWTPPPPPPVWPHFAHFCYCEIRNVSNSTGPTAGSALPPVWPWGLADLICGVASGASPLLSANLSPRAVLHLSMVSNSELCIPAWSRIWKELGEPWNVKNTHTHTHPKQTTNKNPKPHNNELLYLVIDVSMVVQPCYT
jgi:hypothetical protein